MATFSAEKMARGLRLTMRASFARAAEEDARRRELFFSDFGPFLALYWRSQ